MLIEGWEQGHRDRAALTTWLTGIDFYEGASGIISLAPSDNFQGELILLKIDNGKIRPLGENDLPAMGVVEEDLSIPALDLPTSELPLDEVE